MLDHFSLVHSDFRGAAKRLEDIDITLMGRRIGVGEDEIHAFMEVEAAGSGFDRDNRPKMLFEPHVFYRNLTGHDREEAVKQGVAYRGWRKGSYPKDSYPRLKRAMQINEAAALKSCSWGLGQVLGENHAMVGFSTPVEMVIAMMDDEDNHLEAMIEFIIAADIDDDLRAHRWENVARVYNGPGYKTHGYHTRLASAFRKWARIPDTEFTEEELAAANDALTKPIRLSDPAPVNEIKPADSILQMGARGPFVRLAQTRLKAHGYHLGAVDGQFGSATRGAVLKFQADNRLITDGVIGRLTWNALLEQVSTVGKASGRAQATADDVRAKGSSTIKQADNAQTTGVLVTGLGGIGVLNTFSEEIAATSGALNTAMEAVKPTLATISDNWMIGAALFGLAVVFFGGRVIRARTEDHRSGAHLGR